MTDIKSDDHEHWMEELLIRVDTRVEGMEQKIIDILAQARMTNGRTTQNEKDIQKNTTELKLIKAGIVLLLVPLALWIMQSFFTVSLK